MSRLIIKNLPSYVTSEQLKEHFLQKKGPGGDITDVKVARQSDGRSRRFAFIGFKTDNEAAKSQQWFDRTYLGTTKINVQVAETGLKNAPAPRPNKRPRLEKTDENKSMERHDPMKKDGKEDDVQSSPPNSAQLDEFLNVMQPRTKKEKTWANDVTSDPSRKPARHEEPVVSEDHGVAESTPEEDSGALDDLEWLKRRTVTGNIEKSIGNLDIGKDSNSGSSTLVALEPAIVDGTTIGSAVETILRTGRLFLRNLPFSCADEDLKKHFSTFGEVSNVHIPIDFATKTSKGLGYVLFADPSAAVKAYEGLDKTTFQGRLLHILPAAERNGANTKAPNDEFDKVDVKGEKERQRKETAGKEFNWSMLYMNSDAVASSIADRMNISKADILNSDMASSDMTSAAVKLALAETHIIQETKSYLESEGINLSSFSSLFSGGSGRPRRSPTCILVKNIPYGTTAEQISELFEPHGTLNRVLVPPAGTIAVVDFVHADEAAKGFKAVAYRRMGSSIIYLEKAPLGIFDGSSADARPKNAQTLSSSTSEVREPVKIDDDGADEQTEDTSVVPGSTLYVKNLSFSTTTERLVSVFRNLPSFSFARVQTKPDPKYAGTPGADSAPRLSMGFGFIGFKTPDAAKVALKSIHGYVLDGHALSVKFAGRGAEEEQKGKEKVSSTTTKMIVKNVPFEATKKDIRELFGAHGQLKSVRLPKKMNSRTRGFAFLDFISRHEAENAYAALRHTHLLGRHLVLEWAEDSSKDIDALRKKTGVGFGDGSELPGRKRKLDLRGDDGDDGGDD